MPSRIDDHRYQTLHEHWGPSSSALSFSCIRLQHKCHSIIYIHKYLKSYKHQCTYTQIYKHVRKYTLYIIYAHIYIHTYVRTHIIYIYIRTYAHIIANMRICTRILCVHRHHIRIYTYIYTHILI